MGSTTQPKKHRPCCLFNYKMANQPITVSLTDSEILDLLSIYEPEKRETIILKALRIGLIALKDIESVGNVDYVEKEFQKFRGDLEKQFVLLNDSFNKTLLDTDTLIKEKLKSSFDSEVGILPRVLDH